MAEDALSLKISLDAQDAASAAFKHVADSAANLGEHLQHAGAAGHSAAGGLHEAGEGARHGGAGAEEAGGHLGKLREALLDVGKVAGGLVAGGVLTSMGHGIAEQFEEALGQTQQFGEQVRTLSQNMGVSAQEASTLAFAMGELHIDADTGERAFVKFAKGLQGVTDLEDQVTTGGKSTAAILKDMGVSATDADGKTRPFNDVLEAVADKFHEMPDGVEKTARATQLFGKQGADLIPLLNLGKDGLEELGGEARKYGLQLSGENVDAIRKFSLAHNDMNAAIEGARLQIGVQLIPVLTSLVDGLTQVVTTVVPAVKAFADTYHVGDVLRGTLSLLGAVVETISGHIRDLTEQVEGNKGEQAALVAVITPIAALLTAMEVKTIALEVAQLAQTVATKGAAAAQLALNLVMEANPFGAVLLILTGVTAGLIYLYQTSDTFRAVVDNAMRLAGAAFSAFGAAAHDALAGVEGFIEAVIGRVRDLIGAIESIPHPNISLPGIPGHAMGGAVSAGSLSLVGEQGPELFVPSVSGTILPHGQFGGGRGGDVHVHITMNGPHAYDSQDLRNFARQLQPELQRLVTLGA